jgi:hypothetical protein
MPSAQVLSALTGNLDVETGVFQTGLLTETLVINKESMVRRLNSGRAAIARDALAKALYDRLFQCVRAGLSLSCIRRRGCGSRSRRGRGKAPLPPRVDTSGPAGLTRRADGSWPRLTGC